MATPIINEQMDAINESFSNISSDLTTIRPLLKSASIGAYPTDSASGSIASFTDGAEDVPVKELKVNLEPIQNLNGYDNPWPAGGGKNISSASEAVTNSNGNVNASTSGTFGDCKANVQYTISFYVLANSATTINLRYNNGSNIKSWTTAQVVTGARLSYTYTPTVDGSFNFYSSGNSFAASTKVFDKIQVEEGAEPTAYAPYSNICPISGHTEVNVTRAGANLIGGDLIVNGYHYNSNGVVEANANRMLSKPVKCSGETAITVAWDETTVSNAIRCIWDANGNLLNRAVPSATVSGSRKYYTTNLNAYPTADTIGFAWYANSGTAQNAVSNISLKYGTDYAYEPYAGQTYPISLGQTVYGGTLNVTTGVLTVENALITIDNQAMNNANVNDAVRVRVALPEDSMTWRNQNALSGKLLSNMFVEGSNQISYDGGVCFHYRSNGTHEIVFGFGNSFPGVQSYSEAVAWLMANNPTVLYWLATPITYQLTPTQVSTLLGENNFFADAGSVDVVIRADTALFVEKMIAQAMNA